MQGMINKKQQLWLNLMVLLGLIFFPFGAASAQADPFQIFFNPDPAYIDINASTTTVVTVDLANAVDIWSFDVIITYDATVAQITQYAITNWFGSLQCVSPINIPGYFRVSCTAWGGNPVNGDGNLFTLTFEGLSLGETALTFERANFGNTDSERVSVVSDNGYLKVVDLSNLLYLPLIANMQVQGKVDRSGVKLSLASGAAYGLSYEGCSTDNPGDNLLIASVAVDTYTVTASHAGCLSASGTIVIPADAASYSLPALVLRSGNAQDADDIIDVYDLAIVNGAYGDFEANPEGDVNFDGQIDACNLALVAGNFGLTSEMAYAGWLTQEVGGR